MPGVLKDHRELHQVARPLRCDVSLLPSENGAKSDEEWKQS